MALASTVGTKGPFLSIGGRSVVRPLKVMAIVVPVAIILVLTAFGARHWDPSLLWFLPAEGGAGILGLELLLLVVAPRITFQPSQITLSDSEVQLDYRYIVGRRTLRLPWSRVQAGARIGTDKALVQFKWGILLPFKMNLAQVVVSALDYAEIEPFLLRFGAKGAPMPKRKATSSPTT